MGKIKGNIKLVLRVPVVMLAFLLLSFVRPVEAQSQRTDSIKQTIKSDLENCLHNQKQVQKCIQTKIKNLSIDSCYAEGLKLNSNYLKEETLQYCFFQVSEFPTLQSCYDRAILFTVAENHDAALFECIRQHQQVLNQKNCFMIAEAMRFPEKQKHLTRECDSL